MKIKGKKIKPQASFGCAACCEGIYDNEEFQTVVVQHVKPTRSGEYEVVTVTELADYHIRCSPFTLNKTIKTITNEKEEEQKINEQPYTKVFIEDYNKLITSLVCDKCDKLVIETNPYHTVTVNEEKFNSKNIIVSNSQEVKRYHVECSPYKFKNGSLISTDGAQRIIIECTEEVEILRKENKDLRNEIQLIKKRLDWSQVLMTGGFSKDMTEEAIKAKENSTLI